MTRAFFLHSAFGLAFCLAASGQSAFSAKGTGGTRIPEPAAIPAVTVTKPGTPTNAPASPLASGAARSTTEAAVPPPIPRAAPVPRSTNVPPPPAPPPGGAGAIFRPGETFILQMTGMPYEDAAMFRLDFTISGDGLVNIPLGGQVRAAGLTQSQLERAIEKRLIEQKIFRWPTATINVPNVSRYVTVGGAVRAPSRYPWSADMTISSAIMTAGGKGEFATNKINLIRSGEIRRYDYKKIKARPADDEPLLPGDQVELL